MKRVLVVAYYFPPMGMSGVQRITKFVKYLPQYGWEPTVLTVEPGGYFAFDTSLEKDIQSKKIRVERTKSVDPTRLFRKKSTVSIPKESSRKWLSKISQALFIPDNKIGWMNTAMWKGIELHHETPFDVILATIPPYTSALVAQKISEKTGIPYVLDYRDDWLDNPRHEYITPIHRALHRRLEKKALSKCVSVISINEPIANRIKARICSYFKEKEGPEVNVITQGYDQEDFAGKRSITKDSILNLVYSGVFYDAQTPDYFLKALALFMQNNPALGPRIQVTFVGLVPEASKALVDTLGLTGLVQYAGYVSHEEAVDYILSASVLWMTVGEGEGQELISTSKLYEYMGTEKPILGLVPDGAAKDALKAYKASWVASPGAVEEIANTLEVIYKAWEHGILPTPAPQFTEQIERRYLTGLLSELLHVSSSA